MATTLQLDAQSRIALKKLSKTLGRPVTQLLNEAVKIYVRQVSAKAPKLEDSLAKLREYRKKDPNFSRADEAFIDAEATLDDPVEGTPVRGKFVNGKFKPAGRAQTKVRESAGA